MKRFGLIGYPVSHSQSPALFKAAYPGSDMCYDLIEENNIESALEVFRSKYEAVNVTAPFKESAFLAADEADPLAAKLSATNILVKEHGKVKAYNSDCLAVVRLLEKYAADKAAKVVVAGCGGAGKAAALAATMLSLETTVVNRTVSRAKAFCEGVGASSAATESLPDILQNAQLLIYTIPVPLPGIELMLHEGLVVLEANYKDPCLKGACLSAGATYVDGIQWLIEQAVAGFGIMTGIEPDEQNLRKCCTI